MVIIELICGLVNLKGKQRRLQNDTISTGNRKIAFDGNNTTLLTPLLRYE
jgi:hypothetical protein